MRGQPTGIDIGPFANPGDTFRYVRLVDALSGGMEPPFAGADIDAIGAIGTRAVPEPGSAELVAAVLPILVTANLGRRRRAAATAPRDQGPFVRTADQAL